MQEYIKNQVKTASAAAIIPNVMKEKYLSLPQYDTEELSHSSLNIRETKNSNLFLHQSQMYVPKKNTDGMKKYGNPKDHAKSKTRGPSREDIVHTELMHSMDYSQESINENIK